MHWERQLIQSLEDPACWRRCRCGRRPRKFRRHENRLTGPFCVRLASLPDGRMDRKWSWERWRSPRRLFTAAATSPDSRSPTHSRPINKGNLCVCVCVCVVWLQVAVDLWLYLADAHRRTSSPFRRWRHRHSCPLLAYFSTFRPNIVLIFFPRNLWRIRLRMLTFELFFIFLFEFYLNLKKKIISNYGNGLQRRWISRKTFGRKIDFKGNWRSIWFLLSSWLRTRLSIHASMMRSHRHINSIQMEGESSNNKMRRKRQPSLRSI